MIQIRPSKTADSRTCDFTKVSKETLLASSVQHIGDVRQAIEFFRDMLSDAAEHHDYDKKEDIAGFHRDFIQGAGFCEKEWYQRHIKLNRHHLNAEGGVPDDVNLIDVLDMIADCVMAGMARSGIVYGLDLKPELLMRAFKNTVAILKANVEVVE